jgi:hypothetical protein
MCGRIAFYSPHEAVVRNQGPQLIEPADEPSQSLLLDLAPGPVDDDTD